MPVGTKHHGKDIVRELAAKTAWGHAKSFIVYWATWIAWGGAVSCFVGAGMVSAFALVGFN